MRMEPLINYLEQAGVGIPGETLFMHSMPPDIGFGVMLLPSLAGSPISFETLEFRKDVGFQAIVRSPTYARGIVLAQKVFDVLTITKRTLFPAIPEQNIPAMLVSYIRPQQDPQPYPRLEDNSLEVSTNFFMTYAIQKD